MSLNTAMKQETTSKDFDDAVFATATIHVLHDTMENINLEASFNSEEFKKKLAEGTEFFSKKKEPCEQPAFLKKTRNSKKVFKGFDNNTKLVKDPRSQAFSPYESSGWDDEQTIESLERRKAGKASSIEDGLTDYFLEKAENDAYEQDDPWSDADYINYCHDHDMLLEDEADTSIGDIVVLDEATIIDELILSLSDDAGEDTLKQRLAGYDAQMLSESFDEGKEWADYQDSLSESFDEDDYQEDPDAGHYVSTSSPEFLQSACTNEDGDIHLDDDDPEFYIRQECGTVFEGEECHIPPVIESRFDILGGARARNMYASNPKWTGLTGFRYLMNH